MEQVKGLGRALPLVHVACDQDPLHAHLQLPGPLPAFALLTGPEALLAPFFGVAAPSRHVLQKSFWGGGEKKKSQMSWFALSCSRLRACFGPPPPGARFGISSAVHAKARSDICKMERLGVSK